MTNVNCILLYGPFQSGQGNIVGNISFACNIKYKIRNI